LNLLLRFRRPPGDRESAAPARKKQRLEKGGGVPNAPCETPPVRHLQLRDGGKLLLDPGTELPLVVPVVKGATYDNPMPEWRSSGRADTQRFVSSFNSFHRRFQF